MEEALLTRITLTYNEPLLTSSTPATSDFTVSGGKTVSAVTVTGSTVLVDVNSAYLTSDTVTISYTGGTNKIKDTSGNDAVNLVDQAVTINTIDAVNATWAQLLNATDAGSGTLSFNNSTANNGGTATQSLGGVGSYVQYTVPATLADSNASVLILNSADDANYDWGTSGTNRIVKLYYSGSSYYVDAIGYAEAAIPAATVTAGDILRILVSSSDDLLIQRSQDSGANFTTIKTLTGTWTGQSANFIKGVNVVSGTNKKLQAVKVKTT